MTWLHPTSNLLGTVNWGSVPDWLAAAGTIGAVVVALYLADKGSREQREREKRAQASRISSWQNTFAGMTRSISILNQSQGSIYDVAISFGIAVGAGPAFQTGNEHQIFLRGLPPGDFEVKMPKKPRKGMHVELGLALTFRDAQGVYWRRDATGNLYETPVQQPFDGLDVQLPVKYQSFSRAGK